MKIIHIALRAQEVIDRDDASPAELALANEARLASRTLLMMEANASPESTPHQLSEMLRVKNNLRTLGERLDESRR